MIHEFLRYTQKSKMPWKLVVGKPARFEGGWGGGGGIFDQILGRKFTTDFLKNAFLASN